MKKSELRQIIREELYAELSENEQLNELSLKKLTLAGILALASLTGMAQNKVGDVLDINKIKNSTENFKAAYKKTGEEKFNITDEDVKVMSGEQFKILMKDAFDARGVYEKGSPELERKIDSFRKAGYERGKPIEIINYMAPVLNTSTDREEFDRAFREATKQGKSTFEFKGKFFSTEIDPQPSSKPPLNNQ